MQRISLGHVIPSNIFGLRPDWARTPVHSFRAGCSGLKKNLAKCLYSRLVSTATRLYRNGFTLGFGSLCCFSAVLVF